MTHLLNGTEENTRRIGQILASIEDGTPIDDETYFQINYYGPEEGGAFFSTSIASSMCSAVIYDDATVTDVSVVRENSVETIPADSYEVDSDTRIVGMDGFLPIDCIGDIAPEDKEPRV